MTTLSPSEHSKLLRVLELIRRASLDGEILASAYAMRRILGQRSFEEVWPTPAIAYEPPRPPPSRPSEQTYAGTQYPYPWRVLAAKILMQRASLLSPWEASFLTSITSRRSLSPKQRAVFADICQKAGF